MVKDHSDNERGNPLSPHGLHLPISRKGSFICTIPKTRYHIPRPLLHLLWSAGWNEKYLNVSTMKDRSDDQSHHERSLVLNTYTLFTHPCLLFRRVRTCFDRLASLCPHVKYNSLLPSACDTGDACQNNCLK